MAAKTKNYSDYLSRICGLIGIPVGGLTSDELNFLNGYFNTNYDEVWQRSNWIDLCPYGEARFVGNKLSYPNDLSQTTTWVPSNIVVTANAIRNPADGRITASKVLETATTGTHGPAQTYNFFVPTTQYTIYGYARYLGRPYIQVSINDGGGTASAFFNIQAGTVGTTSGVISANITKQNDGFWLWTISLTSSATATAGPVTILTSPDGVSTNFAGNTGVGFYSWGNLLLQTGYVGPEGSFLSFSQSGEAEIDVVFEVWSNSPKSASPPWRQPYEIVQGGLQMLAPDGSWYGAYYNPPVTATTTIASQPPNPVYLYYRPEVPDFVGNAWSNISTYSVGTTVQFTDSTGIINYWTCAVATSAGQSPSTTPSSWTLLIIYDFTFKYVVFGAYADWLRQDGQFDKAQAADEDAEEQLVTEFDQQERQMGWLQPIRYQTHVTSQSRGVY